MTKLFRAGVVSLMVAVVGCTTPGSVVQRDSVPPGSVDLSKVPDAVPKVEPRSTLGNHSPYVVLGKTYRVLPTGRGYQATGLASWYGTKFHGRPTSSGQLYDMYQMTAAHRSLPIPSYVEVKNLDNGRTAVVKVNDRGPFRDGRIIDLSYAGAVRLGFVREGVARVHLATIDPVAGQNTGWATQAEPELAGSNPGAVPAPRQSAGQALRQGSGRVDAQRFVANRLFLQAGAFSTANAAAEFSNALQNVVGDRVRIVRFPAQDSLHRVRVGPLGDIREATRLQALIIDADLGVPLIVHD